MCTSLPRVILAQQVSVEVPSAARSFACFHLQQHACCQMDQSFLRLLVMAPPSNKEATVFPACCYSALHVL